MTKSPNTNQTTQNDFFAREGFLYIGSAIALTIIAAIIKPFLGLPFLAYALFALYFFRNPKRVPPADDNLIVSPADGTVIGITETNERYFSKEQLKCISIFMSPFNVHVNRSPVLGRISDTYYQTGKFFAAFSPEASLKNEQSALEIITPKNQRLVFVQIAGWLARRIVRYPQKGSELKKGEIFGLIRFGSRMDVYLPMEAKIAVNLKQKVFAGETVLARWS